MKRALVLALLVFSAAVGAQQINPKNQIGWPANCNATGMVYNLNLNTCIPVGSGGGSGGGGTWGTITGTLSNQTDLQSALDAKAPINNPTFTTGATTPLLRITGLLSAGLVGTDATGKLVQQSSGVGADSGMVVVAKSCGVQVNCFNVYDDVQTSVQATYTAGAFTGGTGTHYTTGVDAGSMLFYGAASAGPVSVMAQSTSAVGQGLEVAAFKSAGSPAVVGCWTTNNSASATTLPLAITPTGGSGHVLVAFLRGGITTLAAYTLSFSDNGSGATWSNVFPAAASQVSKAAGSNYSTIQYGYAPNIAGGSYSVTGTYSTAHQFRGITVCEFSGLQASGVLDTSARHILTGTATATTTSTVLTASTSDLVVAFEVGGGATYAASSIGGQGAVTTASNEPPFVAGDVGKKFLATTNCDQTNGYVDCYQAFPAGTITAYNGPHSVSVSTIPSMNAASPGSDPTFTGWFMWGHDDAAQIIAAFTAARSIPGNSLSLPCGTMFIAQPPFVTTDPAGPYNPHLAGCAGGGTILVPTADYDYTKANGALFWYFPNITMQGFGSSLYTNSQAWGLMSDIDIFGAGIDGANVTTALPVMALKDMKLTNIEIVGWNWSANVAANAMPAISGQQMTLDNVFSVATGSGGLTVTNDGVPGVIPNTAKDCFFGVQGNVNTPGNPGSALNLTGGHLVTTNCTFNPPQSGSAVRGARQTGGWWLSQGDEVGGFALSGGYTSLIGTMDAVLNGYSLDISGGTVTAMNSQIDRVNMTSGSFADRGGNYSCATVTNWVPCFGAIVPWTQTTHVNSITGGALIGAASVTGTVVTAAKIVLSAGWGAGSTVTALSGMTSPIQFTITNGTTPAASPTITYTFPVQYAVAPLWCNATQAGGTNAIGTFASSALTATGVTFTYSLTPTAASTEIVQVTCEAQR